MALASFQVATRRGFRQPRHDVRWIIGLDVVKLGRPDTQSAGLDDKWVDELAIRSFEKENSIDSPLAITIANFLLRPLEKAEEEKNGSAANRRHDSWLGHLPLRVIYRSVNVDGERAALPHCVALQALPRASLGHLVLKLTINLLKSCLIFALRLEPDHSTVKKVVDTISALAVSLLLVDFTWPDLLPFLFSTFDASHTHPHLQEYALLIYSKIAYVPSIVGSHLATLKTLLLVDLSLPPSLYKCPLGCTEALKLLVELVGVKAGFVAYQKFGGAIIFMLQIAESDRHEEGTRHLAIEFIITLVEELAPKFNYIIYDLLSYFLGRLFDVLMKMLLDLENDPAWYTAKAQDENAEETRWKKRYATLITFAQRAELYSKMMSQSLEYASQVLSDGASGIGISNE
ncbi:hypothetical protein ZIOFF_031084 [Zingiber officinale]|uniref:IPO4/5-like TPR repeats domain-containing protein n=1 Tax=Zingiber officinale TaxID=94328 RepID=A0A8J5GS89_ZINOF|nr:hypothetical protein ZIOFF_031084 [Zingiber officinale]